MSNERETFEKWRYAAPNGVYVDDREDAWVIWQACAATYKQRLE